LSVLPQGIRDELGDARKQYLRQKTKESLIALTQIFWSVSFRQKSIPNSVLLKQEFYEKSPAFLRTKTAARYGNKRNMSLVGGGSA